MGAYLATVMKHFRQVKVVHHLPGRLRLHIPLLERLAPDWRPYQSHLIDIIKNKEGLVDIELSIVTGRVLVRYDPRRINQTQILQWFRKVALVLCAGYIDAPFESKQQIVPFLKKMRIQARHLASAQQLRQRGCL